jgi:hypothetical protein
MRYIEPSWIGGLLAVAMIAAMASPGSAAPMIRIDHQLAAAGTSTPYSQATDTLPTQWDLFTQPNVTLEALGIPEPAIEADLPADLAEPSNGNPNGLVLGHVVRLKEQRISGYDVWGVYDRLAHMPAPRVLHFDPPPAMTMPAPARTSLPAAQPNYLGGYLPLRTTVDDPDPFTPQIIIVPEPASVALLALGTSLIVLPRRKRD